MWFEFFIYVLYVILIDFKTNNILYIYLIMDNIFNDIKIYVKNLNNFNFNWICSLNRKKELIFLISKNR